MTEPVWDGRGEDPWLPQRLQAELDVAATERSIRDAVWAALSDWLIRLSRRVLRGEGRPPDMDAVWAMTGTWREAVDLIIAKAIAPAMQRAYEAVMGTEFPWDRRPFLAQYLAEVRNRLTRTPDEVYDLIAGEVSTAVNLGEGIPQIAGRIERLLSTTDTPRWENRAVVIARTEAIGALNAAKLESFRAMAEEEPDTVFEKVWLATLDVRTRETHRDADGQRVPLGGAFEVGGFSLEFPGDPLGPPQEVINCRCSPLLAEQGEEISMTNRQFKGAA